MEFKNVMIGFAIILFAFIVYSLPGAFDAEEKVEHAKHDNYISNTNGGTE